MVTLLTIACAAAGAISAFMGKKQGNWKVWGTVGIAAAFAAAICLRVLFYQMGASVYPFYNA